MTSAANALPGAVTTMAKTGYAISTSLRFVMLLHHFANDPLTLFMTQWAFVMKLSFPQKSSGF